MRMSGCREDSAFTSFLLAVLLRRWLGFVAESVASFVVASTAASEGFAVVSASRSAGVDTVSQNFALWSGKDLDFLYYVS